jgi:hypothetical protein
MRIGRLVAAVSLVAGVVTGTLGDRTPRREPTRSGEFLILAGDFHVHASPGDGTLTPFSLRDEAARAGLDVIVRERTAAGVLEAIRAGRTVGANERGELFGEPSLVARVKAAMPGGRMDPHPWIRRLAVVLSLGGVAMLLVL